MRAESVEEAVKLINGRDKPLALYVFTGRDKVADLFTRHTSSGGLCINDTIMHLGVEELPFGGVGASGMGAYHGKHGFDTFTHYKVGQLIPETRYKIRRGQNICIVTALITSIGLN